MKKILVVALTIIFMLGSLTSCLDNGVSTGDTTNEQTSQSDKTNNETTTADTLESEETTTDTADIEQTEYTPGLVFTLINENSAYSITNYTGTNTEVIIPSIYNGLPVIEVGEKAFYYHDSITSVNIAYRITSIGANAFEGCSALTSVTFGENSQLTTIEKAAFYLCKALVDFDIPDGVEKIGEKAFYRCTSYTGIALPDSVICIEVDAFTGSGDYNNDDNWIGKIFYIGKHLIQSKKSITQAEIRDGTVYIAQEAFNDRALLGRVVFPESLKIIDRAAFANCPWLSSIVLPDGLATLGDGAFAFCTQLATINLPDSLTSTGVYTFAACFALTSIDIPDSIKIIDERAFVACTALSKVNIGKDSQLESIGLYAFSECPITSIDIPIGVKNIGENAFNKCRYMETINYSGTEAQWNEITKGLDWDIYAGSKTQNEKYTVVYNYEIPTE